MGPAEVTIIYIGVLCPQNPDKIVQGDSIPVLDAEVITQSTKDFLELQGTGTNEIIIPVRSIPVLEMKEIMIEHPIILKEIRPLEGRGMIEIGAEKEIEVGAPGKLSAKLVGMIHLEVQETLLWV